MSGSTQLDTIAAAAHKGAVGGAAMAAGGGLWAWMDVHSTQLGVIFGFVGMVCAVVSVVINFRRSRRGDAS